MLQNIISDFLIYCKAYNFGVRSLEVFSSRLKELSKHINSLQNRRKTCLHRKKEDRYIPCEWELSNRSLRISGIIKKWTGLR